MFQGYLSWIHVASSPLSKGSEVTSDKSCIVSMSVLAKKGSSIYISVWRSWQERSHPGVLQGLQCPQEDAARMRPCHPAWTVLTPGLQSSSTSRLSFQSSSLTRTSCDFLVTSVPIADSWCKDLSSSYAPKYSPMNPNWEWMSRDQIDILSLSLSDKLPKFVL